MPSPAAGKSNCFPDPPSSSQSTAQIHQELVPLAAGTEEADEVAERFDLVTLIGAHNAEQAQVAGSLLWSKLCTQLQQ